jgi:hypothetical protein
VDRGQLLDEILQFLRWNALRIEAGRLVAVNIAAKAVVRRTRIGSDGRSAVADQDDPDRGAGMNMPTRALRTFG